MLWFSLREATGYDRPSPRSTSASGHRPQLHPRPRLTTGRPRVGNHSDNWAILVDTSIYNFNYRHSVNTLSMYRLIRRLGIPDQNIILMLAGNHACDSRNPSRGAMFSSSLHDPLGEVYGGGCLDCDEHDDHLPGTEPARLSASFHQFVEVDYRGASVSVETFLNLLRGQHARGAPREKILRSGPNSNVLVYVTGHGGDGFFNFLDQSEMGSEDLASALGEMWARGRYRQLLFMADTCQASTLYRDIVAPNIIAITSSEVGENSYSHHSDLDLGVAVIDRFTRATVEFVRRWTTGGEKKGNNGGRDKNGGRSLSWTTGNSPNRLSPPSPSPSSTNNNHQHHWENEQRCGGIAPALSAVSLSQLFRSYKARELQSTANWRVTGGDIQEASLASIPLSDFFCGFESEAMTGEASISSGTLLVGGGTKKSNQKEARGDEEEGVEEEDDNNEEDDNEGRVIWDGEKSDCDQPKVAIVLPRGEVTGILPVRFWDLVAMVVQRTAQLMVTASLGVSVALAIIL